MKSKTVFQTNKAENCHVIPTTGFLGGAIEARKLTMDLIKSSENSNFVPHTIFIADHDAPVFDLSAQSIDRMLGDREKRRAFLPILREDVSEDGKAIFLRYSKILLTFDSD